MKKIKVIINYKITKEIFNNANKELLKYIFINWKLIILIIYFLIFFIYLQIYLPIINLNNNKINFNLFNCIFNLFLIAFIISLIIFINFIIIRNSRKRALRVSHINQTIKYTITEDKISIEFDDGVKSVQNWKFFNKYFESKNFFFLQTVHPRCHSYIPKSAFKSEKDITYIRELFKKKIK